jgi:hypothetical protein
MPDNLSDRPSKKRPLELILGALVLHFFEPGTSSRPRVEDGDREGMNRRRSDIYERNQRVTARCGTNGGLDAKGLF